MKRRAGVVLVQSAQNDDMCQQERHAQLDGETLLVEMFLDCAEKVLGKGFLNKV